MLIQIIQWEKHLLILYIIDMPYLDGPAIFLQF